MSTDFVTMEQIAMKHWRDTIIEQCAITASRYGDRHPGTGAAKTAELIADEILALKGRPI